MTIPALGRAAVQRLLDHGALLVDISEDSAHHRFHIPGSLHAPLSELPRRIGGKGIPAVIFLCETGAKTQAEAKRLERVAQGPAFVLEGGIAGWERAESPLVASPVPAVARPGLELTGQFLLTLGVLVCGLTLLGAIVSPAFHAIFAVLGLGLLRAGLTGQCSLAGLLRRMPWNREVTALAA